MDALRARIARIARSVCPPSLAADADDLAQLAAIRVWEKLRRDGNRAVNSSYLWKVVHSVLVDEIRKARHARQVALDGSELHVRGSRTDSPEIHSRSLEVGRAIQDCLGRLVEARRRAVTAYLLGHTVPETARLLGWTVTKAENLVYRGLEQLRSCLKNRQVTP